MQMVYRHKIPPPPIDSPSTLTHLRPPPPFEPMMQQSSSNFSDGKSSSYEKLFPILVEACKKSLLKDLRRSTKTKGKT